MRFCEGNQIVPLFVPLDLGGGAPTEDYINTEGFDHVVLCFMADIGTASEDVTLTVTQAKTNAGGSAKALNFTDIYEKEGATAISAIGQFTKQTQTAANTYESLTGGENEQLICIEFDTDELDSDGGFTHIHLAADDPGAAGKLACGFALLIGPRYSEEPSLTAID